MWNYMGDHDFSRNMEKPPGSIFFNTEFDPEKTFWSLIDGFIVRPTLMDAVIFDEVRIIDQYTSHYLVNHDLLNDNNTIINRKLYPDHLPVEFSIDLNKL